MIDSNDQQKALVRYWLEKSEECLLSAKSEFKEGRLSFTVNRLYYSLFYNITALLLEKGVNFSKHTAVRSSFHREFIRTNMIDKNFGKLYDELFQARHQGDYMPLTEFDKDIITQQILDTESFLKTVKLLIEKDEKED